MQLLAGMWEFAVRQFSGIPLAHSRSVGQHVRCYRLLVVRRLLDLGRIVRLRLVVYAADDSTASSLLGR